MKGYARHAAAQPPIRVSALFDRVTNAAWRTKPSWYAVTEEDRIISPALQREIAARIGRRTGALSHERSCCSTVHHRSQWAPAHRREATAHHSRSDGHAATDCCRHRRLSRHPPSSLAACPGRLYADRRRPSSGRCQQRRSAELRGAARRQQLRRRHLSAVETGQTIGRGPLHRWRVAAARPSRTARRRVPAGIADRERPAARVDHDRRLALLRSPVSGYEGRNPVRRDYGLSTDRLREFSVTSWRRDMRGQAVRR